MKKLLSLLALSALSLQADTEPNYSQIKAQGAEVETLVEIIYEHPEAKEVGDHMPQPIGEKVSYTFTYVLNAMTGEVKESGLIIGYDKDGDKIPEYEFVGRVCDFYRSVKTYAVYDVPHKKLYIDYSRNRYIDSIEDIDSLGGVWTMIPMCGENEAKKSWKV